MRTLAPLPLLACAALAQQPPSPDRELILDADALTSAYKQAMEPLQKHLRDSPLEARYQALGTLLSKPDLDAASLRDALKTLRGELDGFVSGLPAIRTGLWDGAENLTERIHEFRLLLARQGETRNQQAAVAQQAFAGYQRDLADQILAAPPGPARELLKQRFESMSLLQDRLTSRGPDLAGADQEVLRNVLEFLVRIRGTLEVSAVRSTELTVTMHQQRNLMDRFTLLIENLDATDRLANAIAELAGTRVPSFADLGEQMSAMTQGLLSFSERMNQRAQEATSSLVSRLDQAGDRPVLDDAELERRILQASSRGTPPPPPRR